VGDEEKLWRRMRRLGIVAVMGLGGPVLLPFAAAFAVPNLAWMTLTVDRRGARSWLMASTITAGIVAALSATALIRASIDGRADPVAAVAWVGALIGCGCYARGMDQWCSELGWTSAARRWSSASRLMGAAALTETALLVAAQVSAPAGPRDGSWVVVDNSGFPVNGWGLAAGGVMWALMVAGLRQMWLASRSFFVAWRTSGRSPLRPDDAPLVRSS